MADSEDEAEEGPTIETAIGDIVVHAFDVEKSKVHANYRECMGFYAVWERGHGGMRDLYAKSRTFHFCDNSSHAMSEIKLINLLSGFSIEDEFDSPIEEQIAAQRRSAMISRKIVTLAAFSQCAVERRVVPVGSSPTQPLSLRLEAARAVYGGNDVG